MITVISPAKTLDFDTPSISKKHSQPQLLDHSEQLIDVLTTKSPHDLQKLMGISESLAELNSERYRQWSRPFNKKNAKTALLAFKGDVYIGLEPEGFEAEDFAFAQDHLRILSGLYGVLRPLDLIQPYRLEMGTKLQIDQAANLYKFWGDTLPAHINKAIKKSGSAALINLASNEYFKALGKNMIDAEIITPAFKDKKNDAYKMIGFFAKRARGLMSAWIIKNRINQADELLDFTADGYAYNAELSAPNAPVFTRDQP